MKRHAPRRRRGRVMEKLVDELSDVVARLGDIIDGFESIQVLYRPYRSSSS